MASATGNQITEIVPASAKQELKRAADEAIELAMAYTIDSSEMADMANRDLIALVEQTKRWEGVLKSIIQPLDQAKKAAKAVFDPQIGRLKEAQAVLRGSIGEWLRKERLRQERELEEARRREAEERALLEQKQAEAEQKLQAAVESGSAEEADKAIQQLQQVQEEAEAALVAPAQNVTAAQKLAGTSLTKRWKTGEIDLATLVKAAAEDPQWLDYLEPKRAEITKLVRARGDKHGIPGVQAVQDFSVTVRT